MRRIKLNNEVNIFVEDKAVFNAFDVLCMISSERGMMIFDTKKAS
jgi:hypothetical protein